MNDNENWKIWRQGGWGIFEKEDVWEGGDCSQGGGATLVPTTWCF